MTSISHIIQDIDRIQIATYGGTDEIVVWLYSSDQKLYVVCANGAERLTLKHWNNIGLPDPVVEVEMTGSEFGKVIEGLSLCRRGNRNER